MVGEGAEVVFVLFSAIPTEWKIYDVDLRERGRERGGWGSGRELKYDSN
jgi:hypothetical protein